MERLRLRLRAGAERAVALLGGAGIGFYDGFLGPGTGSFFVFLLVEAVGLSFLHASAWVRRVFVVVVTALVLRLALDVLR